MKLFRRLATHLFGRAYERNGSNILALVRGEPSAGLLCDLGCDDGAWSVRVAEAARARAVHGIEIVKARAAQAAARGLRVVAADLNHRFPFDDQLFDLVHANQVIEHVLDTDFFLEEIRRILKPGGAAVVSTENLASWHNIAALLLGWQPFSSTNISRRSVGNPLAVWRDTEHPDRSWQHQRLFSYRGLLELLEYHSFRVEAVRSAGYYPLPPAFGLLDPRHAHFLAVRARKPSRS